MSAPIIFDQKPLTILPPELHPSIDHLVTEDDTPVDSIYSEKQMRLLTEPLHSSWPGPGRDRPFVAMANVGLFNSVHEQAIVPDALLSLNVRLPADPKPKKNRSYFVWEYGKSPDAALEVVSNKEGEELGAKKEKYAQIGVPIYVVWDPLMIISEKPLQIFILRSRTYELAETTWFPELSLGLTIWNGKYEDMEADWLRWCNERGIVIPTGKESAEQEKKRAEKQFQKAKKESQRAEKESQRAEQQARRAERLAEQLRKLGVEPENDND